MGAGTPENGSGRADATPDLRLGNNRSMTQNARAVQNGTDDAQTTKTAYIRTPRGMEPVGEIEVSGR